MVQLRFIRFETILLNLITSKTIVMKTKQIVLASRPKGLPTLKILVVFQNVCRYYAAFLSHI